MKRIAVAVMMLVLGAPNLSAQEAGFRKTLVVSAFAGGVTGGELWTISRQPLLMINDALTPVGTDTLSLARSAGGGITIGSSAVLFLSPRLGVGAEVSYIGPGQDDGCEIVFAGTPSPGSPEARTFNDRLCEALDSRGGTIGSISVLAEGRFVILPRARFRPYLRLGAGFTDLGRSTAEVSVRFLGADLDGNGTPNLIDRPIILDDRSSTAGPTFGFGLGASVPVSRTYSFRVEIRDQLFRRPVPDGPADLLAMVRVRTEWFHNPSLIVGLSLNMQQAAGRTIRERR